MKKLKWNCERGEMYDIYKAEDFIISHKVVGVNQPYNLSLNARDRLYGIFKKLSTAQKVAQIVANG